MKRIAMIFLVLALLAPLAVFAQNEERGEFTAFVDYTRLRHSGNANFWGPGAMVGFNMGRFTALEGGMAYDLEQTVVNTFTTTTGNVTTTTTSRSGLRLLQGLFGPKFQTALGPARVYVVAKGGFLNFQVNNQNIGSGFVNAVGNVPHGDTNGVLYPGVGVEFGKRFGIRAEVGDMIYFDNGANHNLKFMIGPKFSF